MIGVEGATGCALAALVTGKIAACSALGAYGLKNSDNSIVAFRDQAIIGTVGASALCFATGCTRDHITSQWL